MSTARLNCEVCGQAVELSDGTTKYYIPKAENDFAEYKKDMSALYREVNRERKDAKSDVRRLKALLEKVEPVYLEGSDSEWGNLFMEIKNEVSR